jgi:hypothetical protein
MPIEIRLNLDTRRAAEVRCLHRGQLRSNGTNPASSMAGRSRGITASRAPKGLVGDLETEVHSAVGAQGRRHCAKRERHRGLAAEGDCAFALDTPADICGNRAEYLGEAVHRDLDRLPFAAGGVHRETGAAQTRIRE